MALLARWLWSHQQWEDGAAINGNNYGSSEDGIVIIKDRAAIDDDSSNGDGIIILVHPECSVGLAASHASRAARCPILEVVLAVAKHNNRHDKSMLRDDG